MGQKPPLQASADFRLVSTCKFRSSPDLRPNTDHTNTDPSRDRMRKPDNPSQVPNKLPAIPNRNLAPSPNRTRPNRSHPNRNHPCHSHAAIRDQIP